MMMNTKKLASIAVAALGLVLVGYGIYLRGHISLAQKEIHKMAESQNRIVRSIGKEMETKVHTYGRRMNWTLVTGVVLLVCGSGAFFYYRKEE